MGNSQALMTPYQRAKILAQLMDRLIALNTYLRPYDEEEIEYVYRVAGHVDKIPEPDADNVLDDED
jgi:hypothetical protein